MKRWPLAGLAICALVVALPVGAPSAQETSEPEAATTQVADEGVETSASQEVIEPPSDVEIIRVRGRRLDAIATDVPDSVTQFDQAQIEALGAQNISDLSRITPNVEIVSSGATQAAFFIRGVGLSDFSSNAASAVAVSQDGVSLNSPPLQLGQLFDVETVQVLRGPQSFGPDRNASAGAFRGVSRKPTGIYSAQLKTTIGTWDPSSPESYRGLIQDYEGAIEIPVLEDYVSSRLAFRYRDAEPYKTNGCGNAPPVDERVDRGSPARPPAPGSSICGEKAAWMFENRRGPSLIPEGLATRVGDENNWAARGQLRFQPPNTDTDWLLNAHGSRLDQQSTLGQAVGTYRLQGAGSVDDNGNSYLGGAVAAIENRPAQQYWEPDQEREWNARCPDLADCRDQAEDFSQTLAEGRPLDTRPYRGDYNRVGQTKLDTWGAFIDGSFSIGQVKISSLSAYDTYDRSIDQDADYTAHRIFEFDNQDNAQQFWQEIAASGELDATPLTWDVGGYYFMENLDVHALTYLQYQPGQNPEANTIQRDYTQDLSSFAFWGSFAWDFLDDFTLEAGVRYNWERKSFDITYDLPNNPAEPARSQQSETWTAPTGSVSLAYRFNEDLSTYAKYSRGFKPGHYNAQANADFLGQPPARPEYLDSFEIGLQGRWFDDRLTISAAGFFYLYQDYQLFLFIESPNNTSTPVLAVVNANDVQLYGAELETRIEPLSGLVHDSYDGLVIDVRFGWLEGEFIDFQNLQITKPPFGPPVPVSVDYTGNRLPNTPRFKLSGSTHWTFDLGRWGSIVPRYDFSWTDDTSFDASDGRGVPAADGSDRLRPYSVGQADFWLHNARLSYRAPTGNMEVAAWVRNIEDTVYKNYAFDVSQFQGLLVNFLGQPRTFGVDIIINF